MNGVFNGCKLLNKAEIEEEKALDCVHEMDAINHFVGMFPIASGGVVEKMFGPFMFGLMVVMLIGFNLFDPKKRMIFMAVGFAVIALFMYLTYYGKGGIKYQTGGYLNAMVTSLGQGHEEEGEAISPIIEKLQESLLESGIGANASKTDFQKSLKKSGQKRLSDIIARLDEGSGSQTGKSKTLKQILAEAENSRKSGKERNIEVLKGVYDAGQAQKNKGEGVEWTGTGRQVMAWHYEKALGRWFNNPEVNLPMVATIKLAGDTLFGIIILGMVFLVFAGRDNSLLHWLLILVPIGLPLFFLIEYSAWLWWYGHTLNEMGAFTLKPFMPTVFGQGKVAQFKTHSYPEIGFALMMLMAALLTFAALVRRKHLSEINS
ncbi:MAG: hypothetical protein GY927_13435 [bacterium]|nr:hypothetical protein [bacterium]